MNMVVMVVQVIKIKVAPQVQTLQLIVGNSSNITQGHIRSRNGCSPYTLMVVVGRSITATLSLSLSMSASEIEDILNNITVIQDTGTIFVRRNTNHSTSFIFLPKSNGFPAAVLPRLELNNLSVTLSCFDTPTSTNFSVIASLILKQNLTFAEGFQVGYNNKHSSRFTSVLPLNISQEELEEEMNDLLNWVCEYQTPSPDFSVLYSNSFEGNHTGADNTTAFCGRKSAKNPGVIWEDSDGLGIHQYVR